MERTQKLNMHKITCVPVKKNGRKTGEFYASFGEFGEYGNSKQEAIGNLEKALDWYFPKNDFFVTQFVQCQRSTFILEKFFEGYQITQIYRDSKYGKTQSWIERLPSYVAEKSFNDYIDRYILLTPDDSRLF